jgi:hypothetical protein
MKHIQRREIVVLVEGDGEESLYLGHPVPEGGINTGSCSSRLGTGRKSHDLAL